MSEKEKNTQVEKFTSDDHINKMLAESFKRHDLAYWMLSKC